MLDHIAQDSELPDVLFLDIEIPVMDGFQLMEEFVKIKPRFGKKITIYGIYFIKPS